MPPYAPTPTAPSWTGALKRALGVHLLIIVSYVLTGKLALLLALPPSYASAIFPPAGIAIAAAFIAGRRTLPAVFIGALLLNLWIEHTASRPPGAAALFAAAATLQAGAGGALLRRALGYPAALDNGRIILRFLLLAPLVCLTSATLSLACLWALGIVDGASVAPNWLLWWVGDTLGLIVLLPITMTCAGQPRALWRGRIPTVALPMLCVLALFVAMFFKTNQWEQDDALSEFRQISQQSLQQIEARLAEQASVLIDMRGLFIHDAGGKVTRQEFERFTRDMITRFPMILAFSWAARVDAAGRADFEAAQRADIADYRITERDRDGGPRPAGRREQFYPVTYIAPLAGNRPALGFDLASEAVRAAALRKAGASDAPTTSAPVALLRTGRRQTGVLILQSVRLAARQTGVVLTVLKVDEFIDQTVRPAGNGLHLRLIDRDAGAIMYDNFGAPAAPALFERGFAFGGRHYLLQTRPAESYFKRHHGWQSWGVLALGTLGTGLFGTLLLLGTGYTARVVAQVEESTAALRDSESRFRNTMEHAPVGMGVASLDGRFIEVNHALCQIVGYDRDELRAMRFHDIIHPDDLAATAVNMRRLLDGQIASARSEKRCVRKDGHAVWVQLTSSIERDGAGAPVHWIGQVEDITERKRSVELLRKSSEEIEDLYNHAPCGYHSLDRDGVIVRINDTELRWLGYAREELVGKVRLVDLLAPAQRDAFEPYFEQFKRQGYVSNSEYKLVRKDGAIFHGMVNASIVNDAGGDYLMSRATLFDITDIRLAEQRQRHQNRVLQMLAARTPLATVLDTIARDIEAIDPAGLCSILLLDDDDRLRHGAAPSLPDSYRLAIDGTRIGPGVGSCGTAAFRGERVIVANIAADPLWRPYRALAAQAGLAACWSTPIHSAGGRVLGTFAIYHRQPCQPAPAALLLIDDEVRLVALAIEKTRAEARLQLAASVLTHAREGIMITDAAGLIIEVNDAFSRITGYSRTEALGQNPRLLRSGRQPPEYYAAMWRALLDKGHWDGEAWNRRKNGEVYAEMITISAVRDAAGATQNYVALFTDITPMKEHEQQLDHIAHYDALTGLPNRVLLADRLRQAIAHSARDGQSLALVYLDLDGFKAVNDKHGHEVGDQLLIAVAQRMKAALREADSIARIGGDEFVAVLAGLERPQDCDLVLKRLLQAAADPVAVGALTLRVSASIGVTLYPQDGVDADLLMRHADQAMYQAKQSGKNRYHLFDVSQDEAAKSQRDNIEQIRAALAARQFVLHYQPKVNMKSGALIGAEALIRWQHPQRGLLPPAAFLPIIEDHPLGVELGEWVIDTALAQMGAWRAQGFAAPVSVNVGARQLQQSDFVTRLRQLLAAHPDVPPSGLELEILETSALEDMAQVSSLMHACRALGIGFALDDFGTGYSSLTYLKRLPVELLKIDQSFVRDMIDDPEDLAIIEGVVGLASAFRRQVIAEGVETVAHGELLLALGCELGQGYGIARPMPADQLPGWAAGWRPDPAWTAWSARPVSHLDQAMLFAEVEHRHWLRAIETFLAGERDAPPLGGQECRFGQWQRDQGGRDDDCAFALAVAAHERTHALARELVDLHRRGDPTAARLDELRALCGELGERLHALVRDGERR